MNNTSETTPSKDYCTPLYQLLLSNSFQSNFVYGVFLYAFIVLNALIAISVTLSNLLVIFTIATTSSLRTSSNILVLGLAMSDLICGISAQPMYCVVRYWELKYPNDATMICELQRISNGIKYLVMPMTLLLLTAITTDRYLAIKFHLRYQQIVTEKRTAGTVLTSFFIACSCSIIATCLERYIKKTSVALIVVLIVLLTLNGYCIVSVCRVIRRHSRQIHNQNQCIQSNINMPRYKKTVNTMFYVIGAFILCYIPTLIYFIVAVTSTNNLTGKIFYLRVLASTCLFMNGLANPIIYFRKNRELRIAAVQVLRRIFHCIERVENTGLRPTLVTLGLQSLQHRSVLIRNQGSNPFHSSMHQIKAEMKTAGQNM